MRSGIANTAKVISLASSFCGEFTEESLSYIASYWMQRATYNKDAQFSVDELLENGFMGGLVGLFGSAISLGSYNASNIAAEYAARYGINSVNLDITAVASRVDAWSTEKRAQESTSAQLLTMKDYAATAFGLAQADTSIKAANSRYDTFVSEAQAGIDAKSKRLTALGRQITNARKSGDINKLGRAMRQYAEVRTELQKAVAEFQAQEPTNRQARDASIDQNTRAMEKANARLDSHDIALYNLFAEDIAAMREKMDAETESNAMAMGYGEAGAVLDSHYADDTPIDADAIDTASARLLDADEVIRNGQRRIAQADKVLDRTVEKMRAARGGVAEQFLAGSVKQGVVDANATADAQSAATNASAPNMNNAALVQEKGQSEVLQSVATSSAQSTTEEATSALPVQRVRLTDDEQSALIDTVHKLGLDVEFRDDLEPWANGLEQSGKIVLNVDQIPDASGSGLRGAVYRVLAHEVTHVMEGTDEYGKFADFVVNWACKRSGFDSDTLYKGVIDQRYRLSGGKVQLDLAGARSELVADFSEGYMLTSENAIYAIVREQGGFAGKVLNWIQYQIAKTGARLSPNTELSMALLKAERLYVKAFAASGISPNEGVRKYSVVRDAQYDYRVIADSGISSDMKPDEALDVAKDEIKKLRGSGFVSLIDGENISVAARNKTVQKLYRPGLPVNDTKYADRLAIASQMGEAVAASAPMPETDAGAVEETHSGFRANSRANRSVVVEIPEFDASGKLSGARVFKAQLTVLGNENGKIAYDVARINEIKEDAHSDLLRLKNKGVDIDRTNLKSIVSQNADVVNDEKFRQYSVAGASSTWDDYFMSSISHPSADVHARSVSYAGTDAPAQTRDSSALFMAAASAS